MDQNSHISDLDLMMTADRELPARKAAEIHRHLEECWMCRTRMKEIEESIVDFMHAYRQDMDPQFPPAQASRALLKARLGRLAEERPASEWRRYLGFVFTRAGLLYASCALVFVLVLAASILHSRQGLLDALSQRDERLLPNHTLTPGAIRPVAEADLCTASPSRLPAITSATARLVFEEYGIGDPQPRGYELDYLIDPELGGSTDARHLWPQPYSVVWNARLKDALEDHLHGMVCANQLMLNTAQQDISTDWIAAYKKYFHTDAPIAEHLAFMKDEPWSY
jgi:hypothetical protein